VERWPPIGLRRYAGTTQLRPAGRHRPDRRARALAAGVQGRSDDTGTGRYAHVTVSSWNLYTRIDNQQVTSTVVPRLRDTWTAADGSGRLRVTTDRPGRRPRVDDSTEAAGGLGLMWPLGSLSADDVTLAEQLAAGHPAGNGPAERLVAITDAYLQMPIPPAVRAALLRYLAATPGLRLLGDVVDRNGRSALGFAVDSAYSGLPTRYTLVFDPHDGRLLDSEQMLTTTAGRLNVPIPSVIGYQLFLSAGYTDSLR
jgi:hypothetical protein